MIVEVATIIAIQFGGMAAALTMGNRQLRFVVPAGFIAGVCIYLTLAALQSIALLQTRAWLTMVLTMVLPVGWWFERRRRGTAQLPPVTGCVATLAAVGAAAATLHAAAIINFHVDSHEYLAIGSMLAGGTFDAGVSMFQIEKRMLAVPLMHASATEGGGYYLASITPMVGVATVLLLAWMIESAGKAVNLTPRMCTLLGVAAALFLLSFNRYVHNLFYINGHLLFATLLLVLAGTSWVMAISDHDKRPNLLLLQLLAIPVLVVTRPEAGLVAALAIAPAALSAQRPVSHRMALVTTLGASIAIWQLFLLRLFSERGSEVTTAMLGMLAFGAFLLACSPLLVWDTLSRHRMKLLSAVEILLWGTLAFEVTRNSEVMIESIRATAINVLRGVGGWGMSLAFLAVVSAAALSVGHRSPDRVSLRYPLTAFVPLAWLLVYLSDGGYRVGAADSLNRMLIQLVPLAILFVAATAFSVRDRQSTVPSRGTP